MKYIKTYETIHSPGDHWLNQDYIDQHGEPYRNPDVGDYVIVQFSDTIKKRDHNYFMESHVGQIIDIKKGVNPLYKVDFGVNIPGMINSTWTFVEDGIVDFSLDKEELETLLISKQYF